MAWLIIIAAVVLLIPLYLYIWYRSSGIQKKIFSPAVLMLHNICNRFDFSISNVKKDRFIKFIEEARTRSWNFRALDDYFKDIESGAGIKNIYLTFDDGYDEIYDIFHSFLEPNSIPIAIFLTTGFLGKRAAWDYKFNPPVHLSLGKAKEMAQSPLVTFGSHSVSHPDLCRLTPESLRKELHDSRKFLMDNLQREIQYLSVPFGRHNLDVMSEAKNAGYKAVFCGVPYRMIECDNIELIPRIPLNLFDNLFTFTQKIEPGKFSWMEFSKSRVIELFSGLTYQARGRH
jgi:peptidoglycan/xylan/chitin deacetylase (PgdA/CDA1 family)